MTDSVDKRSGAEGDALDAFLGDAIAAARDRADDGVDDGAHTRLRVREALANRGAARRKRFTLLAAVIASLFGSTAFAYWAGWRPPWTQQEAIVETHEDEMPDVSMRLPDGRRGSAHNATPDGVQTIVTMEQPPEIAAIPDAGLVAEIAPAPAPPAPPIGETHGDTATTRTPSDTKSVSTKSVDPKAIESTQTKSVDTKSVATKSVATKSVTRTQRAQTKSVDPTSVATTPTTPVETTPVETAASPRVTPSTETKAVEPTPSPRVTTSASPPDPTKPSAEIAAYRAAHEQHFRGGDPKAALRAWDDFLAKYPNQALAPEARYNRALVLVKLARWSEARAALAPFASAKVGAYRQKEAAEILAAIKDR